MNYQLNTAVTEIIHAMEAASALLNEPKSVKETKDLLDAIVEHCREARDRVELHENWECKK